MGLVSQRQTIPIFVLAILLFVFSPGMASALRVEHEYEGTTVVGGPQTETINAFTTDDDGNLYIGGRFNATVDFDPGASLDSRTSNGLEDAFLIKFDSDGSYVWTKTFGGITREDIRAIAVDEDGGIYAAGIYSNTVDFNPGGAPQQHTSNGGQDNFVIKFSADGEFEWVKAFGGGNWDYTHGIATDSSNNAYVIGSYQETVDFNPGGTPEEHTTNGSSDGFIVKYENDGTYAWSKSIGGTASDASNDMDFGEDGSLYLAGSFGSSSVDFNIGGAPDIHTNVGTGNDAFISKLNADGSYGWTKTFGGAGTAWAYINSISVGLSGGIYLTGGFKETVDFDAGASTDTQTGSGEQYAFVAKYNLDGSYGWTSCKSVILSKSDTKRKYIAIKLARPSKQAQKMFG